MDKTAFIAACSRVMDSSRPRQGIGTLGEKTLHAVLKCYFEPDSQNWEVLVPPYVADIKNDSGIVEIQTAGLYRLLGKLQLFLETTPVTVVYPVPHKKWLVWLDEDGTASPRRKSSKTFGPWTLLPELYGLKPLLSHKNLRFCVVLLELEEFRLKNGWSADGKRGSTRFERMPIDLIAQVWAGGEEGYHSLLPPGLPEEFTMKDFIKLSRLSPKKAAAAVSVLLSTGTVKRIGSKGRAYIYSVEAS